MNIDAARAHNLITLYFTQLTRGCQNTECENENCASSPYFLHSNITANQAAVLAIRLTADRASLCSSLNLSNASNESSNAERCDDNAEQVSRPDVSDGNSELSGIFPGDACRRFLSSPQVARLIMYLYNAPENDEINEVAATNTPSSVDLDEYAPYHESLLNRSDIFNPSVSSSNTSALKSTTISSVSSSTANHEYRKDGLTLDELKKTIETDKANGNCSLLIALLTAVFSSYDALASSFLIESEKQMLLEKNPEENAKESVDTDMMVSDTDLSDKDQTQNCSESFIGQLMDSSTSLPCTTETDNQLSNDSDLNEDEKSISKDTTWPSVNLQEVRLAWAMIVLVTERQNIVDTLLRAVRRLVVINLHQLLVMQPPEGLDDSPATGRIGVIQQKLVNLFLILYECPFATDPLHFELLLLNINRAVTWLPMSVQVKLCRAWANAVYVPLANSNKIAEPEQTNLWCLQKILLHHITLRCLTTDHGSPNEDKQICEAALVLRIVYYASLLAGEMDLPELLLRESEYNQQFQAEMLAHRGQTPERRLSNPIPQDPLAKALNISPNDCRKPFIPTKDFINETLNDGLQLKSDYQLYRSKGLHNNNKLSFMKLPFLLQTSSKSILFYCDNRTRMFDERHEVFMHSLFVDMPEMPFLKLHVARERLVEDALLTLEITCLESPGDFKKQLLVEFEGEQGIDEGGLSKEFFQLIIERVFNPDYGMFVFDDESQTFWFNPVPIEDMDREYCLIGNLLGLAIYNNIILDIRFPSVLYRKLVGKLGTFDDFLNARPSLARGLKALLDYDGDNVEEEFGCAFVINYHDLFGNVMTSELKPNGSSIPVSKENKKEYVDLYANFILNDSVSKQFNAFRRGFLMVVDESPLTFLFRPDEIEILVCGYPEYDFKELEKVTLYVDYTTESEVIKNFWTVIHSLTEEQQKQFLQFSTGSDRVPLGGMAKMKFTIARQGAETDRLPTAHTCFNILLLPEYENLEKLRKSLLLAITYCKGFGLS